MSATLTRVAGYICEKKKWCLTVQTLNTLAFYCQAYCMAWRGECLFPEDFTITETGPRTPLLDKIKQSRLYATFAYATFGDIKLEPEDQDVIDTVLSFLPATGHDLYRYLRADPGYERILSLYETGGVIHRFDLALSYGQY